jgi:flagellar basal body-associated protein FliL
MKFCTGCGKQLTDDDRFCSACGREVVDAAVRLDSTPPHDPESVVEAEPITPTPAPEPESVFDAGPPTSTATTTNSSSRKWILAIVALVLIVAAVVTIVMLTRKATQNVAAEKAAAQQALKPFQKLDSALTVGLNFDDYGAEVRDVQYAVDSYNPSDSIGEKVHEHLVKAASMYKVANDAWNDDIQSKFTGDKTSILHWSDKYPALGDYLTADPVKASDVEQAAWQVSQVEIQAAQQLLNHYSSAQ